MDVAHVQPWKQSIVTYIQPILDTVNPITTFPIRLSAPFDVASVEISMTYDNSNTTKTIGIGIDEWSGQLSDVLCFTRWDSNGAPVTWHFPRPVPVDQTYTLRMFRAGAAGLFEPQALAAYHYVVVTITLRRSP